MVTTRTPPLARVDGFVVAHRAGNDLDRLRDAAQLGARLIEADVRLFHGKLVIRHLKSIGPLPIFWDRWYFSTPFERHLRLDELLDAVEPLGAELMLDLKGRSPRLARLVRAAIDARRIDHPITVCARDWRLLDAFRGTDRIRTVCSVGSRRGLRRLLAERRAERLGGISIHEKLLDEPTVRELTQVADVVMTWPVNTPDLARTLLGWGVHGLITDEADAIAPVVRDSEVAA
jgi:glycerophosphoryl diester phosphodiesterase